MFPGQADEIARSFRDGKAQSVIGAQASVPDVLEQIRKLGELRDSGLLTADEFEEKKSTLLERL